MSKSKLPKIDTDILSEAAQRIGLTAMSAAMVFSILDLSSDAKRIVLPNQPVLVQATENEDNNPVRREREETVPHFISYSEVQRTPSRSGRG